MKRVIVVLLCVSVVGTAQQKGSKPSPEPRAASGSAIGVMFSDFYYVVQDTGVNSRLNGANGFSFRRIYLGYEQNLSQQFVLRIILEANNDEQTPSKALAVFVKYAFAEWKDVVPLSSMIFGMSPTPTWVTAERIWGYRSLEKTILDRVGLGSAADMSVSLRGRFDPAGEFSYTAMVGNGKGTQVEDDKNKKIYISFGAAPSKGMVVEVYGDFENHGNEKSKTTGKFLAGYEMPTASVGLEAFYRVDKHFGVSALKPSDLTHVGASLFEWSELGAHIRSVARVDYYDPDVQEKKLGQQEVYGIIGIDYVPSPSVHFTPNVIVKKYLRKDTSLPDIRPAVTARVTLSYSFPQ